MSDLGLTALVRQRCQARVEAVMGFVDRIDEAERELECRRHDGTTFRTALRSLFLKDEDSVVKLSLWGKKTAVQEPRREKPRVGDLLVVTHVQVDRFMGDKSFKASGFRPQLRVIRDLASARPTLDKLHLEEIGPYVARAEQLWQWKELEDIRDNAMHRQAQAREEQLAERDWLLVGGFESLALGREDAHVRVTAWPVGWVEGTAAAATGRKGLAAVPAPAVAPRFLRTRLVDGKGLTHWMDLPQGMEGVLAFEQASSAAASAAAGATHPPGLPVVVHNLEGRAFRGLVAPFPTARSKITMLSTTSSSSASGLDIASASIHQHMPPPPSYSSSSSAAAAAAAAATAAAVENGEEKAGEACGGQQPSVLSVPEALRLLRGGQQPQHAGLGTVLTLRGRVVDVEVAGESLLAALEKEEEGGLTAAGVAAAAAAAAAASRIVQRCPQGQWRYRDMCLRIASEAGSGSEENEQEGGAALCVCVADAQLVALVGNVPAAKLAEEAHRAAAASREERELLPSLLFFTAWVVRALTALAAPNNPPFRLTVRVVPSAAATSGAGVVWGPALSQWPGGSGDGASFPPVTAAAPAAGGGGGSSQLLTQPSVPPPHVDLRLLRLAEAPALLPPLQEEAARAGGACK